MIDIETTGLDNEVDRVVSVAVVLVEDGRVIRESGRHVLVNPGIPVSPQSTAVHGITDSDVANSPPLDVALTQLRPLLAGRTVVGHNLPFDLGFLPDVTAERTLDTRSVSRLLWRWPATRHSLDAVAARVGIEPRDRHTALGDAVATAEVLVACLPLLAARGLDSPEAVAEAYAQNRARRSRVRRSRRRRVMRGLRPRNER